MEGWNYDFWLGLGAASVTWNLGEGSSAQAASGTGYLADDVDDLLDDSHNVEPVFDPARDTSPVLPDPVDDATDLASAVLPGVRRDASNECEHELPVIPVSLRLSSPGCAG